MHQSTWISNIEQGISNFHLSRRPVRAYPPAGGEDWPVTA